MVKVFLIILFILISFPFKIIAQDSFSLSVSPPTFEFYANPRDILNNSIRVENLTDNPISVATNFRNFIAVGEEGAVNLTEEENNFSLNKWITIAPSFITIPPKNRQEFRFIIQVPHNAEPGGHFGSIVFKSGGINNLDQTGASISQEIGTLVLVKVAGVTNENAKLETFKSQKKIWEYGPVEFETRIKNDGNIQIKPLGTITIKNIFGKKITTIPVEPKNILPGAIRKNNTQWNQKLLIGRYTATLSLSYGNPNKLLIASTHFYGLPWKISSIVFSTIIIFGYLLYRARRRIKKAIKILFSKE